MRKIKTLWINGDKYDLRYTLIRPNKFNGLRKKTYYLFKYSYFKVSDKKEFIAEFNTLKEMKKFCKDNYK